MATKPEPQAANASPESSPEAEKTAQEVLLENLPAIAAALVVLTVVAMLWTFRGKEAHQASQAAWRDLGQLQANTGADLVEYEKLAKQHAGSAAAPYIQLAWAAKLYERGERDSVEQARDLLRKVLDAHGRLELIQRVVPSQLQQIEAELGDASVPWEAIKSGGAEGDSAEDDASAGEVEVDEHAGHDHPPGEHPEPAGEVDEHAGHDHPPGEHPEPAVEVDEHAGHDHPPGEHPEPAGDGE